MQRFQALAVMNQTLIKTRKNAFATNHSRFNSLDIGELVVATSSCHSDVEHSLSRASSYRSLVMDNQSWSYDQASASDAIADYSSTESLVLYSDFFCLALTS